MPRSAEGIYAFRQAAPDLATSGQPQEDELAAIAEAGYEVIINLALHDDPRYSLQDEASSVNKLGIEYIHIPVQFGAPTTTDLIKFFDAMSCHGHRRIWVHCAANKRVTAFLGLYRCLREGWPEAPAFALLREIWQPDEAWSNFIASQLAKPSSAWTAARRFQSEDEVIHGSCHCGAVKWQFKGMPESATACNCTVCRRYGVLWVYDFEGERINVSGPTRAYVRGKAIEFHFCPTCGCVAYWRSQTTSQDGRRRIAANLRLTEPDPVARVPIDHFEGLNTFEDLPRDGRCVADYWF